MTNFISWVLFATITNFFTSCPKESLKISYSFQKSPNEKSSESLLQFIENILGIIKKNSTFITPLATFREKLVNLEIFIHLLSDYLSQCFTDHTC